MIVRDATPMDAVSVAARLRAADRHELAAAGLDTSEVEASFAASDIRRAVEHRGRVVAVFGREADNGTTRRAVWLLATEEFDQASRAFSRVCREEVERMRQGCGAIGNCAHRDNKAVIRWLQWIGFTFLPRPVGPGGVFLPFVMPGLPGKGMN